LLAKFISHDFKKNLTLLYFRGVCKIVGIKVETTGEIEKDRPVFWVSNHSSYLDIVVLGCFLKGSFVAKSEVSKWPLIGSLARLGETLFVERNSTQASKQLDFFNKILKEHKSIIMFPEGTTAEGNSVLRFKSSLFDIATLKIKDKNGNENFLKVQPISIACVELNEFFVGYEDRAYYAWIGDEFLFPHLFNFFKQGKKKIIVNFLPSVSMSQFNDRKEIANYCRDVIADSLSKEISGK
jgi:1-acyl-sn-glycerol-3-phosphate acyltransferase